MEGVGECKCTEGKKADSAKRRHWFLELVRAWNFATMVVKSTIFSRHIHTSLHPSIPAHSASTPHAGLIPRSVASAQT
jgi:hypothetical protein